MGKYKLSKKYILKVAIARAIILLIINIVYTQALYKIPYKYSFIAMITMYCINILGGILVIVMPIAEYLSYRYIIDEEYVEIKSGIIFRRSIYIPRRKIKYIIVQRDPLDYIFKISSLRMYTTAGRQSIKALEDDSIKRLWNIMDLEAVIK